MNLFLILRLFSIIVMGFWGGASLNQFKGTNPTARPYGLPGTGTDDDDDDDQYYYCYSGGYYYDDDYYYLLLRYGYLFHGVGIFYIIWM